MVVQTIVLLVRQNLEKFINYYYYPRYSLLLRRSCIIPSTYLCLMPAHTGVANQECIWWRKNRLTNTVVKSKKIRLYRDTCKGTCHQEDYHPVWRTTNGSRHTPATAVPPPWFYKEIQNINKDANKYVDLHQRVKREPRAPKLLLTRSFN